MQQIPLKCLIADPRNPNVCDDATLSAIKSHIGRTGQYQALTVRPDSSQEGHYIIVDGHHRKLVLEQLDYDSADCQVWDLSEADAELALLTLNRLRGTDNPRKRAELLDNLLTTFTLEDLTPLLPESEAEIEGLVALLRLDTDALDKKLKAQMKAEKETLPVPFGFMVQAADVGTVKKALALQPGGQDAAFIAVCRLALDYDTLTAKGEPHG